MSPNPDKPEKVIFIFSPLCYSKEKGGVHAEAMTTYMKLNNFRIFDYPSFSQPLTEQVRKNAEQIACDNGIEIEFIRKFHAFRKCY